MISAPQQHERLDVLFIGRANIDLTVRVPHMPRAGRTAIGSALAITPGGKSLNQSIAAARLGGHASLVANVGADDWGSFLRATLINASVDVSAFRLLPDRRTGAAIIHVTPDAEGHVTLALSPETELTGADIHSALSKMDAPVLTTQLDLPPDVVGAVLSARRGSQTIIGNLIPHPAMERKQLEMLDVIVVNVHEAAAILDVDRIDPITAADQLRRLGPTMSVVTAGPDGAAYSFDAVSGTVPAERVSVIDTTGAGDAFLGALALHLAHHLSLPKAVAEATRVGSLAVRQGGAQLPPSARPQWIEQD